MRKFCSIILLAVFCNSFFYYSYFSFAIIKAKIEAAIEIRNIDDHQIPFLLKVNVAALQKNEGDEVWYNNQLYDVAERKEINDTGYVFLLRDEDEQNILADNSFYFHNDGNLFSGCGYKAPMIKNGIFTTDNNYITGQDVNYFLCIYFSKPITVKNKPHFISACIDVLTPPPEFS
ncbi:MAG: hypothetical protein JST87_05580 [Bacteroidetes bacterium]|nr:hypothetical protein [Bacteroidota bacterium]